MDNSNSTSHPAEIGRLASQLDPDLLKGLSGVDLVVLEYLLFEMHALHMSAKLSARIDPADEADLRAALEEGKTSEALESAATKSLRPSGYTRQQFIDDQAVLFREMMMRVPLERLIDLVRRRNGQA